MLTDEEVSAFWRDGFVAVEDVLLAAEIQRLRDLVNDPSIQLELRRRHADRRTVHLIPLTTRHQAFRELACDARLTKRVACLIGDDLQLSNSKLATKPCREGVGPFPWHQDFAYYAHTNHDLVTIALALDDVTTRNGAMHAVRGSHRLGLLDHFENGWMTGGCVDADRWTTDESLVAPMVTRAGGITIHHCLTLHGSPANISGKPRRLIVFQYRAGDCYQLSDHVWEDTGYQVLGSPSGRVRCIAMDIVLPRSRDWERYSGEPHGSVYRQIGDAAREWNIGHGAAARAEDGA